MAAEVAVARERLLEAVADVDDTLVERYLLGQDIPVEELMSAIRQATIGNRITPGRLRNGVPQQGSPADARLW